MKIIRTSTIPMSLDVLLEGQLKFLSQYFEVKCISSDGAQLYKVKEREGVEVTVVNMERGISPIKDLRSLFKLFFQLRVEKPIIVHSITPKAGLLTMLAARFAGVPIRIHTFTGLIFPSKKGFTQRLLIFMDKLLCNTATHIYPEGNGVKDDLINYKITSKPLRVLANGNVNGINLARFCKTQIEDQKILDLKKSLDIDSDAFVFIFVGRLVGDKGINELVAAFKKITLSYSHQYNPKLLLVGPLESELDPLDPSTLEEIESNPNIISVGFQNDVRPYFAISDALVFPSYREGFPNVVIQAGAMGLPSIVSNINGCNEIIIEGENGTIIPIKNPAAIQEAMLKMLEDKIYYNSLQVKARQMIQERYEQQVVWDALLKEYNSLLSEMGLKDV